MLDKIASIQAPDMKVTPELRNAFIKQCEEEWAKDPENPIYACVAAAKDSAAIDHCSEVADAREHERKPERGHGPRKNEAELQLNKIGKNLKTYYIVNAAFPQGAAKQLPAKSCCGQPNNRCAATQDWLSDPVWQALDFSIDEDSLFQYSYTSDGKTFHAEAIGDLDCDGISITYKLDGDALDGKPRVTLTPPPPNSD